MATVTAATPPTGNPLGDQPTEGMSDHRRLAGEKADRLEIVVGDALHHLVREHTRVLVRLLDRVGVVGPSGCDGDEVVGLEQIPPLLPAAGQQPQSVHKGHRRQPRLVRTVDLGLLPVGNGARCKGSLSCRFSPLSRPAHLSRVQEFGSPNLSRPLRLIDKRVRAGLDVRRSPHVVRAGSGTRPPGHHAVARRSPQRRLSDTAALHHERPDGSSGVAAGCGLIEMWMTRARRHSRFGRAVAARTLWNPKRTTDEQAGGPRWTTHWEVSHGRG